MFFSKVEISQFRNLISTSFSPSPSLNLISGSNGSGKSSLLEALHYLSTGTSFRTHRLTNIIHTDYDCFTLFTLIGDTSTHRIGLKRCKINQHQTRVDNIDINRRSDLLHYIPVQVISPESINILLDGSEIRRNFIDWALFHVEHSFHYHLSSYLRALKQRNALLKSSVKNEIDIWNSQLTEHGEIIDNLRRSYLLKLTPVVNQLLERLLPEMRFSLKYRPGWTSDTGLQIALTQSLPTDIKLKHTTVGPHRADFVVKLDKSKAIDVLSRGQLKLIVIALKLAQTLTLQQVSIKTPVLLIDDIAAELDKEHRQLLLDTVQSLCAQVFITTPQIDLVDCSKWSSKKVFHVEHGQIKEVV